MHHGYPKVGDSIEAFITVCGSPSPDSTDDTILFDIPGIQARLTCCIDEQQMVYKLSSSMLMEMQAAVELAKRFLPEGVESIETHLDTESEKLNTSVQTYRLPGSGKKVMITADESGSFQVEIQE